MPQQNQSKNQLPDVLNKQIANWNILFVKLHNYHWYVTGPQFFTLHAKFEQLYNEAAQHIDDLAERLLALGGSPLARIQDYLQEASIQEADGNEIPEQMVVTTINDLSTMAKELKDGITQAAQSGDESTGDMLLAIHTQLEKHVWMLKAFNTK